MKWQVKISKVVRSFLKEKRDGKFVEKVLEDFSKLSEDPFHHPELDIKKMRGSENDYRLRIGEYRFIYTVFKEEMLIYIYKVGKRGDIY